MAFDSEPVGKRPVAHRGPVKIETFVQTKHLTDTRCSKAKRMNWGPAVNAMAEGEMSGSKTDFPGWENMERSLTHSAESEKWKKVINDWAKFAKGAAKK